MYALVKAILIAYMYVPYYEQSESHAYRHALSAQSKWKGSFVGVCVCMH